MKISRNDHRIILNVEEIDRTFDEYLEKLSTIGNYLFYFSIRFKRFLGLGLLSFCEKVLGLVKGRLTDNYEPAGTIVDALFYDKTPEGKWGTKESRI